MKKFILSLGTVVVLSLGVSTGAFAHANTYTVKSGDSLWKISKKYHVSISQLKSWNHLKSDRIKIHQKLKVSGSKPAAKKKTTSKKVSSKKYRTIRVSSTAYTIKSSGGSGITATGINLRKHPNTKVISVNPKLIPLGSKVYVPGYGNAIAGDTGGAMHRNKYVIDLYVPTYKKAIQWGRRTVTIKVYY
ncbi:LysM peptidoglycan-binding domain-containing protein [Terrilactibacillus laevilacticus]|uniref:LysM peptidoglycan-binding domain-containing protein n=1 Tax=Terrilactibacillus laevilacticus TaxID=1380157 RepID=A0ABW5PU17_9BACI|nr:LysM peptidoglycan-binding domain-containing protein [Terrilactibacillus laevilacticus]